MRLDVVRIPCAERWCQGVGTDDLEEECTVVGMLTSRAEDDGEASSGEERAEYGKQTTVFVLVRHPGYQEAEHEGACVWRDRQ